MRVITHYVVESSSWKVVATAASKDEAYTKCNEIQESANEWNYDHPHREPRYYEVVTESEYYNWLY